jgi:AcrR family transcriptional regulator
MPASQQAVRLAGEDLGDLRHVCALVEGPEAGYELLMPFILEGFERGDRAVHLVDPDLREAHLGRLRARGIDVERATASHQLDVQTWSETYLRGGRFDGFAQLDFIRRSLSEGPGLGYPVTRAIGTMEWADGSESPDDLLAYESAIDELLTRVPDVVICEYDLNRHSARTIADILGVHGAAVVGGVLRPSTGRAPRSARERLIGAAWQLFQETGIKATGVDAIIKKAGVAKATFYRHFPSKDDLVVAWLKDPRTRWLDGVRAKAEATGGEPVEVIRRFFEGVADRLESDYYRCSAYLNTAVEITEPTHPARQVIREYVQENEDYFAGLLAAGGYRDPTILGTQLLTLLGGAVSVAVMCRSKEPALAARDAAMRLLEVADRA